MIGIYTKREHGFRYALFFAVWTGLEPATPCVTGRYSNQLNYHSVKLKLVVPYSHMGKPHTTIGITAFHF